MATVFLYRMRAALFYWLWIPGLVLGSGWLLDRIVGWRSWHMPLWGMIGAVLLLVVGLFCIQWSSHDLARYGGGTPSPARPSRQLVTRGSFGLCRHPMHLGYDLMALGVLLLCRFPGALFVSFPFFLLWQWRFLKKEEVLLGRRFRKSYPPYREAVPFLVPSLSRRSC